MTGRLSGKVCIITGTGGVRGPRRAKRSTGRSGERRAISRIGGEFVRDRRRYRGQWRHESLVTASVRR